MAPDAASSTDPLAGRLVALGRALRLHGIDAGPSELADAAAVITVLGLDDRERLRSGIAAATLHREGQRETFDQVFDIHFPAAVGARTGVPPLEPIARPRDGRAVRARAAALREQLVDALARQDDGALDRLAARAVDELGRVGNDASSGSHSARRALDALAPQTAIAAALRRARDAADALPGGSGDGGGGSEGSGSGASGAPGGGPGGAGGERLSDRWDRDEMRARVAAFRRRVETEATRRNAEARGTERLSRHGVRPSAERRDFLLTGSAEAAELEALIDPLARRLATRLAARQKRASRGAVDIRRTLRAAMATGGVPVRPVYRRRHRTRPDVVLLCDMSGSVLAFSRFSMLLLRALSGRFRRVRFFGFVNTVDEITEQVRASAPGDDVRALVATTATMARHHGSSDYGTALADMIELWGDALTPRTTVLVLGDARTNGTDPNVDALREIVARSRRVLWLNPEPVGQWDSGDSVASAYSAVVDMHEVRTIEQLRTSVSRLMPV